MGNTQERGYILEKLNLSAIGGSAFGRKLSRRLPMRGVLRGVDNYNPGEFTLKDVS